MKTILWVVSILVGGAVSASNIVPASVAAASRFDSHIRTENSFRAMHLALPFSLEQGQFQQDIDHAGALPGQKFTQRYWIESSYASPATDAPVIYHICGEGDCTEGYFLHDNAIEWAKALGAHIVYLEHRYYGQSLPFNDFTGANLKYLTLNNAIEDLATFQKAISASRGFTGKWIVVGGSYSATLSAIYRQKHPELVVGSLAASAPMVSGIGQSYGGMGDSSTAPSDDRAWTYQGCSEFGFWQAEGGDFNAQLDLPSQSFCASMFGEGVPHFNSDDYNKNYDLPFIANAAGAPSNILFTYGSEDVWTRIGLSLQTNANPNIKILLINGAGHHFDLNAPESSDSPEVVNARATFLALAKQWLGKN